jgi:hypothetical protein
VVIAKAVTAGKRVPCSKIVQVYMFRKEESPFLSFEYLMKEE